MEYRWQRRCGTGGGARTEIRTPPRRLFGWDPNGSEYDRPAVPTHRRRPRSAYVAGRHPGRQQRRSSAIFGRDFHGATDLNTESEQPERSLAAAWESSITSCSTGVPVRKASPARSSRFARAPSSDSILGGLTTAVAVLSADLEVIYLNAAAEVLLGVSLRQSLGRPIGQFVLPPDELTTLCRRALADRLTYGCRELAARVGEQEVILDCRASPSDGSDERLLLELFDAQRDWQVRREAESLAQQRLSRRIIRQLAHEVKNPLGGLRGAAQLLERQLPAIELRAYTDVIIAEADRLAALVDGILKAGRPTQQEKFNVHEITEHVGRLIEAEKPEGVVLARDYDPSLPLTLADRGQLIQAFLNLARNAMQALGESGQLIFRTRAMTNCSLGGQKHRLVLSLEVEDNGPGVPDDLNETIFYPLVTGRDTGTGLGLTIAQELVSQNGGLIEYSSHPGATIFQLRLPVSNESDTS